MHMQAERIWKSILNHLDYSQSIGFTTIWISPVSPVSKKVGERTRGVGKWGKAKQTKLG